MYCTRWLAPLFLATCLTGYGQEGLTAYSEPQIALNYALGPYLKQNAALRSRLFLMQEGRSYFATRQADLSLYTTYTWMGNSSVALGLLYRFRDPFEPGSGNELRITEQFNIRYSVGGLRLGHRIRWEQRIFSKNTIHRLRYRLAADAPLQGEKTDIGEFYLIGQAEPLLSLGRTRKPQWDMRLTGWFGLRVAASTRLQVGGEYRWESFNIQNRPVLLLLTSLILGL